MIDEVDQAGTHEIFLNFLGLLRSKYLSRTEIPRLIYDYTSGYPYLVSRICKLTDEVVSRKPEFSAKMPWTRDGIMDAVGMLLRKPNTLFDDMIKHLAEYLELNTVLPNILFNGAEYTFYAYNTAMNIGVMFGFLRESEGKAVVANRIFEMHLYQYYLSEEMVKADHPFFPTGYNSQFRSCRKITDTS